MPRSTASLPRISSVLRVEPVAREIAGARQLDEPAPRTEVSTALYSISREPLPGHGPERVAKGRTRRNTELGKSPMEVTADGPVRQEQSLGDLLVRQTRRREADDLELLGRQTVLNAVTRARF